MRDGDRHAAPGGQRWGSKPLPSLRRVPHVFNSSSGAPFRMLLPLEQPALLQFDPNDYLISASAYSPPADGLGGLKSAEGGEPPSPAAGRFRALRVELKPCSLAEELEAAGGSPKSRLSPASTASGTRELRSPPRRPPGASAGGWPGSGSDWGDTSCDEDAGNRSREVDDEDEHHGSHDSGSPACSLLRQDSSGPPPPHGAPAPASASPVPLPQADSSMTPPAFQLSSKTDSSSVQCSAARWAAMPGSTRSGSTRSGSSGSTQQQQVDVLEAKLLIEAEERRALQRRLVEQRSEADRQRQALGEQYEAQLAALRRQVQERAAVAASAGSLSRSIAAGMRKLECRTVCC